jgi:proteasome accessory factor C
MSEKLPVGARLRRLLAMLVWLADRGEADITEMAERFAMSTDELVAELELAACCGLPPYTPDQLMDLLIDGDTVQANVGAHLSRPVRFGAAEGFTVAAAARAILAVPGAGDDGPLASALSKLEKALGAHQPLAVDLDDPALLAEVRQAAEEGQTLRIVYYSASRDEATERAVDPYGVYSSGGRWYLDAFCHRVSAVRHFRVDRIESVAADDHHFEPPPWSPPAEVFAPGPDTPLATLLLPASATWVAETCPVESLTEEPDGRLRVTLAVGGEAWLARLLLRAGPGSEVLEPEWLRDCGAEAARRVLVRYASSSPDD